MARAPNHSMTGWIQATIFVSAASVIMAACQSGWRRDVGELMPASSSELRPESTSHPLRGFAHLASGEWTTTLASGDILLETWRWEPDGRSLRVVGAGGSPDGTPWREEQVFSSDGETGEVRVRGSNSYRSGAFEGTVTFGDGTAEAWFVLTQDNATRQLVRRWRFEGTDRFETELLEVIFGEGLVPLVSWTFTRTAAETAAPPAFPPGR